MGNLASRVKKAAASFASQVYLEALSRFQPKKQYLICRRAEHLRDKTSAPSGSPIVTLSLVTVYWRFRACSDAFWALLHALAWASLCHWTLWHLIIPRDLSCLRVISCPCSVGMVSSEAWEQWSPNDTLIRTTCRASHF